jgi:hypothetical protein
MIISYVTFALACFILVFREKMRVNYSGTGLPKGHRFFDPAISGLNKYKNQDPHAGPAFPFSTTYLVAFTDFFHLLHLIGLPLLIWSGWLLATSGANPVIAGAVYYVVRGATLSLPRPINNTRLLSLEEGASLSAWRWLTVGAFFSVPLINYLFKGKLFDSGELQVVGVVVFCVYILLLIIYVKNDD